MIRVFQIFKRQPSRLRATSSSTFQNGAWAEVRVPATFWNLIIRSSLRLGAWGLELCSRASLNLEAWRLKFLIASVLLLAVTTNAADLSAGPLLHDFPLTLSPGPGTE